MPLASTVPDDDAIHNARRFFAPASFGFELRTDVENPADEVAWVKAIPGIGRVCFTQLSWQHGDKTIPWQETDGTTSAISFLEAVTRLEMTIWGMPPLGVLPPLDMAIVHTTGGHLLVAYLAEKGFSNEGWLGFAVGFGAINRVLVSHMLGTRPELRSSGIGWHLKLLQAYTALKAGHHTLEWTFDPMRSSNAWFNFGKFGLFSDCFLVNKYGHFASELYGSVPSDRFVVTWQVTNPAVQHYVQQAWRGELPMRTLADIAYIPAVTVDNIATVLGEYPRQVKYEIPGDIDALTKTDSERAMAWRRDSRLVFMHLLNTHQPYHRQGHDFDPAMITLKTSEGPYRVTEMITGIEQSTRRSFYIFTLKE